MFRLVVCHLQAILTYCLVAYNYTKRKMQEISVIYVMTNFIWLHVSTRNKSSSGHLNLLNKFKWSEDDSLRVETCSHMKFIIYTVYNRLIFPLFCIL
jgi:hypothetical protein